jgi:hypothetical protein
VRGLIHRRAIRKWRVAAKQGFYKMKIRIGSIDTQIAVIHRQRRELHANL